MLVYGLSSSGMTISLHYCCGKLDGVSFYSANESKTCKMGNHFKKSGCCNDKQIYSKVTSEQEQSDKWLQVTMNQTGAIATSPAFTFFRENIISPDKLARGTPVPISSIPLFILNCVFRV